jgi:cytochrome c peroxidase
MNMDMRLMQERLKQDPVYVRMFDEAGLGEPSNGGARKALVSFMKTLTSRAAPFDEGEPSAAARRGFELFKGKGGCAACHSGPRFTDDEVHVTGVPANPEVFANPQRHMSFAAYAMFMGVENFWDLRRDVGAYVRDHRPESRGAFLTPGLRELSHTSPYMHNGVFETLAEVVAFYNDGGGDVANKDPRLKPLGLSAQEQADLVSFLESLSGEPLTGPAFVVPEDESFDYEASENWPQVRN